jgi:ABC-2 type transport system permease protein
MWKNVLKFELNYRKKRPATYLYFFIFFLLCFAAITSENVHIGATSEKVLKNAPTVIFNFVILMSAFGILVASAVMGVPLYRDIEYKTDKFFFSLPLKEKDYLLGRFLGSFFILLFIFSAVQLAIIIGGLMPWVEKDQLGPVNWGAHLQAFLILLLPNLLFTSSIFFSLVALTRRIMAAYTGSIILLVAYIISFQFTSDLDRKWIAELLDPFALTSVNEITRYWSIHQQNFNLLPLSGNLLYNRFLWGSFSLILLGISFYKFSFSDFREIGRKHKNSENDKIPAVENIPKIEIPFVSWKSHAKQMLSLSWMELKNAVGNPYFASIVFAGMVFLFLDCFFTDEIYGTPALPVTYNMIESKNNNFILFVLIILIYYSGEMIYKERGLKFDQILDALPIPNWMVFGSKLLAMFYICFLLASSVIAMGLLVQLIKGYFNFELGLYFTDLYLFTLPYYLIMAVFIFFIMIMVNNKFIGFGIILLYWLARIGLSLMDYDHNMLYVGNRPSYIYSDMNGFGHYFSPLMYFTGYWAAFSLILIVIGNLFWPRGILVGFQERKKLAGQRWGTTPRILLFSGIFGWLVFGGWIFYNTVILNDYKLGDTVEEERVRFEQQFKKYGAMPFPKICDVKLEVDLFPMERKADIRGKFLVSNVSDVNLDSLLITVRDLDQFGSIQLNGITIDAKWKNELYQMMLFELDEPMLPGDTLEMKFDMYSQYDGFPNEMPGSQLNYNGSFFNTSWLPGFGYDESRELASDEKRKKYGLEPRVTSVPINDPIKKNLSFISTGADYVQFEVKVSTDQDQVAIVPGYLQKTWEEDGRNYFQYKTEAPGFYFFSVLSAKYEILKDTWTSPTGQVVDLEIYHHPGHTRNLDRMIKGMKKSLEYFSSNFSPYQHSQLRILEFPRYSRFAQSFANTVPFSEAFGFVSDFSDEKDIDYSFYVTAHEVAHQWWGHQVMPRATNGASTVSETMSQYSALMVMEHEYGKDKISKFLEYELRRYLRGRGSENKYEPTLLNSEGQGYVHYRKGSMAMYALKDYLGEENLNRALEKYVDSVAFQSAPFTSSLELYEHILSVTPDSLKYVAEDLFERRVLYENRTRSAEYEDLGNGGYRVTLEIETKKFYEDSLGKEIEGRSMNDFVDIGIFGTNKVNGEEIETHLYLKKHRMKEGSQTLEFIVHGKPEKAGIDPYIKLIDRNPDDNKIVVSEKGSII